MKHIYRSLFGVTKRKERAHAFGSIAITNSKHKTTWKHKHQHYPKFSDDQIMQSKRKKHGKDERKKGSNLRMLGNQQWKKNLIQQAVMAGLLRFDQILFIIICPKKSNFDD